MSEIENFLQGRSALGFSSKRVFDQGKSFDELFVVDGIPLFWFYKRYLLKHVLPQLLNTYAVLERKKKLSLHQKAQLQLSSQLLPHYIFFKEMKKIRVSLKSPLPQKGYPSKGRAFFLTYFEHLHPGNQLYRIQGIIDQLRKDNRLEPFPLFVAPLSGSLLDQDLSARNTIYQYYDKALFLMAKERAKLLAQKWKKIELSSLHAALTLDGKLSLWPYLRYAFSLFMSPKFLSLILLYYELSKKAIEKENVALAVISGQNGLFERCMAAAARTKGIPCLLVPHGYAIGNLPPRDLLDNMYLPVFNRNTEEFFIKAGVPENQVRVTGPAMYDAIVKYKRSRDKRVKSRKRDNTPGKNILFLTQPLVEDNLISEERFFELVEKIVRELFTIKEASIVIKLHPRERGLQKYKKIIKRIDQERNRILVYQHGEIDLLYSLLKKADVVVNFYATAGVLEASILDVPSITFPFDGKKSDKYGDFDPSIYVWEIESLRPTVEKLLNHPSLLREKRRKMVQELCSVVDGKSSQRVAQWAYELLEKKA